MNNTWTIKSRGYVMLLNMRSISLVLLLLGNFFVKSAEPTPPQQWSALKTSIWCSVAAAGILVPAIHLTHQAKPSYSFSVPHLFGNLKNFVNPISNPFNGLPSYFNLSCFFSHASKSHNMENFKPLLPYIGAAATVGFGFLVFKKSQKTQAKVQELIEEKSAAQDIANDGLLRCLRQLEENTQERMAKTPARSSLSQANQDALEVQKEGLILDIKRGRETAAEMAATQREEAERSEEVLSNWVTTLTEGIITDGIKASLEQIKAQKKVLAIEAAAQQEEAKQLAIEIAEVKDTADAVVREEATIFESAREKATKIKTAALQRTLSESLTEGVITGGIAEALKDIPKKKSLDPTSRPEKVRKAAEEKEAKKSRERHLTNTAENLCVGAMTKALTELIEEEIEKGTLLENLSTTHPIIKNGITQSTTTQEEEPQNRGTTERVKKSLATSTKDAETLRRVEAREAEAALERKKTIEERNRTKRLEKKRQTKASRAILSEMFNGNNIPQPNANKQTQEEFKVRNFPTRAPTTPDQSHRPSYAQAATPKPLIKSHRKISDNDLKTVLFTARETKIALEEAGTEFDIKAILMNIIEDAMKTAENRPILNSNNRPTSSALNISSIMTY